MADVKEIVGKVVKKYVLQEVVPSSHDYFPYSFYVFIPTLVERVGYEVECEGKSYEVVAMKDCDIPVGAEIAIRVSGKFLKKISLLYGKKEFQAIGIKVLNKPE